MRFRSLQIAIVAVVALGACSDEPTAPSTPVELFDSFWSTFDREYSYFAYKQINWDSLRTEHRPQALAAPNEAALIPILRQMLVPLRDLHVVLIRPDGGREATYSPTTQTNWDRTVWHQITTSCGLMQPKPELGSCLMSGIGYVFVGSWGNHFTTSDLDAIVDRLKDAPSIIIDVRPNPGGNDALALALASRFAAAPVTFGFVRFRNGPDHDDFGAEVVRRVTPRGSFQFQRPVIVLAGRGVYSSNETFIAAMRELPNVTILGDTTGGASGNPVEHRLDRWRYTVSRWIETTADRRVIEWNGIPPDTVVAWNLSEVSAGRDPVLEAALARLRNASLLRPGVRQPATAPQTGSR